MHFYDLFVPEDREVLKDSTFQSFANREPFRGVVNANLHKNGSRVVLESSGVPVLDTEGALTGYRGTDIDITARVRVEEAVRRAGAYNRSLIEASLDPLVMINPEGKISDVNAATVAVTGFPRNELIGTDFSRYFTEPDRAKTGYETVFRNGSVRDYALDIRHRDGHTIPVLYNATVFRDESGAIAGVIAAARDITEQKKAEDALKERECELAGIISFLPDATLVIDKNGTLLAWNRAMEEMTGVPKDRVLGKRDYEYSLPFYHERRPITADLVFHFDPAVAASYPFMKKEGNSILAETYIPHLNNGSGAYLWLKASPLYDAAGHISGAVETIRDITESRRAEEALRQANKQLNLLSSITRHDILNMLIALRGYIELSREFLDDKDMLAGFLEKEETAARTIEDQILFTRDYQDLGIAVPEWQNVNASVQKAVAGLPMRDIRVTVDRSDLEIYADPLFRKVFHNLIENALNYGGPKMKTIRVLSEVSGQGLTLLCEDDGAGISSVDKKHLFTRGFGRHTGLGLFLSQEILAITGITITEEGEPGRGARFRITVPEGAYRVTGKKEKQTGSGEKTSSGDTPPAGTDTGPSG
jgi:PAS domain S-box-containing protein